MSYDEWKKKAKDTGAKFVEPRDPKQPQEKMLAVCGQCGTEIYKAGYVCMEMDKCPVDPPTVTAWLEADCG